MFMLTYSFNETVFTIVFEVLHQNNVRYFITRTKRVTEVGTITFY